jgi:hypothetical protein
MIDRLLVLLLGGCVALAALIVVEWAFDRRESPVFNPVRPRAEPKPTEAKLQERTPDELIATVLARPLFSPSRRSLETASPDKGKDTGLRDLRLTGIVIESGRRFAMFAQPGTKLLIRSEGEALNDWRVEAISAEEVTVSGPGGTVTLEPKPDANRVRPSTPAVALSGQPQPGLSPGVTAGAENRVQPPPGASPLLAASPGKLSQPQQPQVQLPPELANAMTSLPPPITHLPLRRPF